MASLEDAVFRVRANQYSGSGDWLNEATTGSVGDGTISGALFYSWNSTEGNYVRLPFNTGDSISTPDAAKFDITGDIDLRIIVRLEDWTPSGTNHLLNKGVTSGWTGWFWEVDGSSTGKLKFAATNGSLTQATSSVATGFTDGTIQALRVTWDASADDVKFYTGDGTITANSDLDTITWSQLGTTQACGNTVMGTNGQAVSTRYAEGGRMNGRVYAMQVYDGIDGTKVADFIASDWTDPASTYTDGQSNVWTCNRSSGSEQGRIVDRSHLWCDGVNDYTSIADHADLDFDGSTSLTIGVGFRTYDVTPGADMALLSKRNGTTTQAGYGLHVDTGGTAQFGIGDGTNGPNDQTGALTDGAAHTAIGVRNVGDDDIEAFADGTGSGSPTTDSTTATLANANALRIGTHPDSSGDFKGEIWAACVIRSALTDAEVSTLHTDLLNQTVTGPVPALSGYWGIRVASWAGWIALSSGLLVPAGSTPLDLTGIA